MVLGLKKKALRQRALIDEMNALARPWTTAQDGEEFFARYMKNIGYCVWPWERGPVLIAKTLTAWNQGTALVAEGVRRYGRDWKMPTSFPRNCVQGWETIPDPRRYLS